MVATNVERTVRSTEKTSKGGRHMHNRTSNPAQGYNAPMPRLSHPVDVPEIFPPGGCSSFHHANRTARESRKAKRALRSRIKPEQQRCGDRIAGPGPLFEQSKGVPRLPPGGDGLADVSLRPFLVQHSLAPCWGAVFHGLPQRPATTSRVFRRYGGDGASDTGSGLHYEFEGRSRARSLSAPPKPAVDSGIGCEVDSRTNNQLRGGRVDDACHDAPGSKLLKTDTLSVNGNAGDDIVAKTPIRPAGQQQRGHYRTFSECQKRNTEITPQRDRIDVDLTDEQEAFSAEYQDQSGMTGTSFDLVLTNAEGCDATGPSNDNIDDTRYVSPPPESPVEGREARVLLFSSVPLSPRARAKTPTLPADRASFREDAAGSIEIQVNSDGKNSPRTRLRRGDCGAGDVCGLTSPCRSPSRLHEQRVGEYGLRRRRASEV